MNELILVLEENPWKAFEKSMNELILVLEENPEIQAVISASMKDSPIFINQELDPDYFLQQVQNLNPDLILFLSVIQTVKAITAHAARFVKIQQLRISQ